MKALKLMKLQLVIGLMALALGAGVARGGFTFNVGTDIPQGNPVGLVSVGNVSGLSGNITSMTVDLTVSGGFNGALYAYLVAPNESAMATLLGVPGGNFDQIGSGYNVTLSDTAVLGSIQNAVQAGGVPFTGTYQPVGSLTAFNGLGANGDWTLVVADQFAGGGQAILNNWSLTITTAAVPEPDQITAMALLSLLVLMACGYRSWSRAMGLKRGAIKI